MTEDMLKIIQGVKASPEATLILRVGEEGKQVDVTLTAFELEFLDDLESSEELSLTIQRQRFTLSGVVTGQAYNALDR